MEESGTGNRKKRLVISFDDEPKRVVVPTEEEQPAAEPAPKPVQDLQAESPQDPIAELREAIGLVVASGTDSLGSPEAAQLFAATDRAASSDREEECRKLLREQFDRESSPSRNLFAVALMRDNDRELRGHGLDGLLMRRVDFSGGRAEVPDMGFAFEVTPAGALVPWPTDPNEGVWATIATELHFFTEMDEAFAAAGGRPMDTTGLQSQIEFEADLGLIRKRFRGLAVLVLASERAFGFVFDDSLPGRDDSTAEAMAMPMAMVDASHDGSGSIIAFSAARALFEDCQVGEGLGMKRMPYANINGTCSMAIDVHRVMNERFELVRPAKGQVAAAITSFVPRS